MTKVAILLSGHLRNIEETITNFNENLIIPISESFEYDIYIHTWDNNITNDKVLNNDNNYNNLKIDYNYITNLFQQYNITIKKIIIENQEQIYNKLNLYEYLNNLTNKSIHDSFDFEYVKDMVTKLYFQYYGHYKTLKMLENENYTYIIKTRPDMYYNKFNVELFNYDIFIPFSHQKVYPNNPHIKNINQLFFGGKSIYIIKILQFFENVIYHQQYLLFTKYHPTDINFNFLFRYYIFNILKYNPFFTGYNPKIYRNKEKIITLV